MEIKLNQSITLTDEDFFIVKIIDLSKNLDKNTVRMKTKDYPKISNKNSDTVSK